MSSVESTWLWRGFTVGALLSASVFAGMCSTSKAVLTQDIVAKDSVIQRLRGIGMLKDSRIRTLAAEARRLDRAALASADRYEARNAAPVTPLPFTVGAKLPALGLTPASDTTQLLVVVRAGDQRAFSVPKFVMDGVAAMIDELTHRLTLCDSAYRDSRAAYLQVTTQLVPEYVSRHTLDSLTIGQQADVIVMRDRNTGIQVGAARSRGRTEGAIAGSVVTLLVIGGLLLVAH